MMHTKLRHNNLPPEGLNDVSATTIEGVDSLNLIDVESVLRTDLRYCADCIEAVCGELLLDPPAGVYLMGRPDPAMIDGRQYFFKEDSKLQPVKDLNEVDSAVYDDAGKIVIPSRYMKDKGKLVSNTPFLPYRGLLVAKQLVDWQIDNFAAYHRASGKTLVDLIGKHFKNSTELDEQLVDYIESCYTQQRREITLFLGENRWNMIFTRLQNTTLVIERCMDWRAWEWEEKHGEAFRNGRYS